MNQERPNEAAAKLIFERETGVDLRHADTGGESEVDYLSLDEAVALEVTAVTDGEKRGALIALRRSIEKGAPATELQGCWFVYVPENQAKMRTFVQRVKPAIAELEFAGVTRFDHQRAAIHVLERGDLSSLYKPLLAAGVVRAVYEPHQRSQSDAEHSHQILVIPESGGSATSSNDAVERLVSELGTKEDNPRKLLRSGAEQRHLFVWLDGDTPYNIARSLSHTDPLGEGWGLPTVTPKLHPAITHLWIMHQWTGKGWLWNGHLWAELQDLR